MNSEDIYVAALRRLCEVVGGPDRVAAQTGLSSANIKQILAGTLLPSGNPRGVGPNMRKALAESFPSWMASDAKAGFIPPGARTNVAEAPALAPSRLVPVVGHVKGGPDGFLEEMQFPVGQGEGFVPYWTKDPMAYALRVKGDSMHPRYRAREFIVVTPSIEAQQSNDVVVRLKDGRKLLKQLNWARDGEVQLVSINDGYAPMTISCSEIDSIQRVAGGVPPDAFTEPSRS